MVEDSVGAGGFVYVVRLNESGARGGGDGGGDDGGAGVGDG